MNRRALGFFASILLAAAPAMAGPPLLCFPHQIGTAQSLPWGDDAFAQKKGYDKSKLVEDTLKLLKAEKSTLVNMETLRRAAIYIGHDAAMGEDLVTRLNKNATNDEFKGATRAAALFQTGYLAATLKQNGCDVTSRAFKGDDAYSYIKKALPITPDDAAMQFGAALVSFEHDNAAFKEHLKLAIAGAPAGSDLAKTIEGNWACGHKPIGELCKEYGVKPASQPPAK
jgi:hypothetical protein